MRIQSPCQRIPPNVLDSTGDVLRGVGDSPAGTTRNSGGRPAALRVAWGRSGSCRSTVGPDRRQGRGMYATRRRAPGMGSASRRSDGGSGRERLDAAGPAPVGAPGRRGGLARRCRVLPPGAAPRFCGFGNGAAPVVPAPPRAQASPPPCRGRGGRGDAGERAAPGARARVAAGGPTRTGTYGRVFAATPVVVVVLVAVFALALPIIERSPAPVQRGRAFVWTHVAVLVLGSPTAYLGLLLHG